MSEASHWGERRSGWGVGSKEETAYRYRNSRPEGRRQSGQEAGLPPLYPPWGARTHACYSTPVTHACVRCFWEVTTSMPSFVTRFFSCRLHWAGQKASGFILG